MSSPIASPDILLPANAKYVSILDNTNTYIAEHDVIWSFKFKIEDISVGDQYGFATFITANSNFNGLAGHFLGANNYATYSGPYGISDVAGSNILSEIDEPLITEDDIFNIVLEGDAGIDPDIGPLLHVAFDSTGLNALSSTSRSGISLSAIKPNSITVRAHNDTVIYHESISDLSSTFSLTGDDYITLRFRYSSLHDKLVIDYHDESEYTYDNLINVTLPYNLNTINPTVATRAGLCCCSPLSTVAVDQMVTFNIQNFHIEGSNSDVTETIIEPTIITDTRYSSFTTVSGVSAAAGPLIVLPEWVESVVEEPVEPDPIEIPSEPGETPVEEEDDIETPEIIDPTSGVSLTHSAVEPWRLTVRVSNGAKGVSVRVDGEDTTKFISIDSANLLGSLILNIKSSSGLNSRIDIWASDEVGTPMGGLAYISTVVNVPYDINMSTSTFDKLQFQDGKHRINTIILDKAKDLTYLRIDESTIDEIDCSNSPLLKTIILNNNYNLESIIGDLVYLQVLTIRNSKISTIDINAYSNLVTLDIERNNIESIVIADHKSLRSIQCGDTNINRRVNSITSGYDYFDNKRPVESLYSATLQSINISDMESLKTLIVNGNYYKGNSTGISTATILNCPVLENIDMRYNNISDIFLRSLYNLKSVDYAYGDVETVDILDSLLENVDVSHNNIKDISTLGDISNVKSFNLSHNKISDLDNIGEMTNLHTLYAEYNIIEEIDTIPANVTSLRLDHNNITTVTFKSDARDVNNLKMSHNPLLVIDNLPGLGASFTYNTWYYSTYDTGEIKEDVPYPGIQIQDCKITDVQLNSIAQGLSNTSTESFILAWNNTGPRIDLGWVEDKNWKIFQTYPGESSSVGVTKIYADD